ncbi:phosphonate metabolism protein/1,5-bisphosphokinase (PRPP-forming) PhnN [Acuticoccus mangrovi]|uniref:Ribose 1,5-bisphosphate phosphokinase PhnN n=1 Tax=Acuticoccus mangrovi TaxID=2796142 RepID=A0A934MHK2_9HYPH|nr:phosphonate metabolism protein/1,5-bisphosphokinase (PRPP-forming) PhnN [Acuticoccus mangrovi]MBJ3777025.1 phosphonate metabolism protein/1,5-bisphosphokinase (PRPP-forming) PhnN [Acuticoccus mangrovi]
MQPGTLFIIVGASGVGKDTLLSAAVEALEPSGRYVQARRVITRPAGGAEAHEPVTDEEFERRLASGELLAHWRAHGLSYGWPVSILDELKAGRNVLANGSRGAIPDLSGVVDRCVIVEITAPREIIAERLAARGRESAEEIEARLNRHVPPLPATMTVAEVMNDGTVEDAVNHLIATLERYATRLSLKRMPIGAGTTTIAYLSDACRLVDAKALADGGRVDVVGETASVRAIVNLVEPGGALGDHEIGLSREGFELLGLDAGTLVSVHRTPSPKSREILRRKIAGRHLGSADYETLFRDIVDGRYTNRETAAFLVKTVQSLDDDEVVAVARARCAFSPRIDWEAPVVVDKHSLGGVPGSRITLIVVPIVAACGLVIPKTSSRAITSASGTADVMEALCRIDLGPADVRRVVGETGGCIAWNGRLNHSVLDDIVNAITRPLALDSNHWSVASIMSKKFTAGSTHVVIDMPFGPRAKLKTEADALELGRIFELTGAGLGLTVRAFATDGSNAIGNGIGPALELRDVLKVLENAPDAPADLREKALFFASEVLSFAPGAGSLADCRARAEAVLASGAAREKLSAIASAQGARPIVRPGSLHHTVRARTAGAIARADGWHLAGIARTAGAPHDKSAGVDLHVRPGVSVARGEALYTIHASDIAAMERAVARAEAETGFTLVRDGAASPEPARKAS